MSQKGAHWPWTRLGVAGVCLVLLSSAVAQEQPDAIRQRDSVRPVPPQRQVVVSIPDRKLAVMEDGVVLRVFPVSVGAVVSPSPTGEFQIVRRLTNPTYYHPGTVIPPGKENPLGPRWIGLNKKGFGIHGTNAPRSVGNAASHGCIRLTNRDIVKLYALVHVGDTVVIRSERDAQIAQIFDGGGGTASSVAQVASAAGSVSGGQ